MNTFFTKIILFFLLFNSLSPLAQAHDSHYDNAQVRRWVIEKEKAVIEGTFYLLKEDKVFIEDTSHTLFQFPFSALSADDQRLVRQKQQQIDALNTRRHPHSHQGMQQGIFGRTIAWWVCCFVSIGLCVYILKRTLRKQQRYLMPLIGIVGVLLLSAFYPRAIRLFHPTTDPSTLDAAFVPFIPHVHTFYDANYFYVESKGIPATHPMMVGISNHGWQRQVPIPQCYLGTNAWPIPLNPVLASNPIPVDSVHFTRGAIAIAANGVPIFNVHTNTGVDSYLDGQLDNYGGHCGRADDYHYHIAPLHLYNYTTTNLPIAYGLDGYAVYGSVEPDGSPMLPLDENHGHLGSNGVYHYHGTPTAPYMIGRMAGQVTEDATHQLVPQAAAHPVRPALTPLNGALITACTPNAANNGYTVTYTRNGVTDSIVYSWNLNGVYTFKFYTQGNLDSTKVYNGHIPCEVPPTMTATQDLATHAVAFSVYPVPAKHSINIQLQQKALEQKVTRMELYSLQGELIFESSTFQQRIDIATLTPGVYWLTLQIDRQPLTKKIIIQ